MKTHNKNNTYVSLPEVSDNSDIGFEQHTDYFLW